MIAWEKHSKILHPFGSWNHSQRYGPVVAMGFPKEALDTAMWTAFSERTDKSNLEAIPLTTSDWIPRNTLDPFLHQAIFYFLRGQDLRLREFAPESVVAFDCAIQSVAQLLQIRKPSPKVLKRSEVCQELGLTTESAALADYIYFLRNNFGAHAGGWRWWDVGEMLQNQLMGDISNLVERLMAAAADREAQSRFVDPYPEDWSWWFFEQFEMLWDAVWFERIDKWSSRRDGA